MSYKTLPVLAVVLVLAMAPLAMAEDSDASPSGTYKEQLDANGQALYAYLESRFAELEESPVAEASFTFTLAAPVILASTEDASDRAESLVGDVLTAYYMMDPTPIWLWDLPDSSGIDVKPSTATIDNFGDTEYKVLTSVSFKLTSPSDFSDAESIKTAMKAVKDALATVSGDTDKDKVVAINDILRGKDVTDEVSGECTTVYDALVTGASSSSGIAAAFTALCAANGVTAMTVNGLVMRSTDDDAVQGYWNYVRIDGTWYAVDSTFNGSDSDNCLLAGSTTKVDIDGGSVRFLSTHAADVGFLDGTTLSAPALSSPGWDWPEAEESFFDKYGMYIFGGLIAIIIIAVLLHAVRVGDA